MAFFDIPEDMTFLISSFSFQGSEAIESLNGSKLSSLNPHP